MPIRLTGPLLCAGAALVSALAISAAGAAPTNGQCNPTRVKFSASALPDSPTTAAIFANIPEAVVTFTQGGGAASCVLVRFSASTFGANPIDVIVVRALLDGTTVALPASIRVRNESDTTGYPRSFEFIFPSVTPGSHTVRMQFKSEKGNPVHVKAHNTVVQFVP